ncbi:MAG: sugar phosphate isomerase/epimerase, partial [Candidatus Omnitrophica bacterium]|nr:sugar phosphate isomerase/epimerase [Candidatus Omnitrophota bacterium]
RYSSKYFFNILKSLDELSKYAQKNNVYLGIENRFYYYEIPSLEEIGKILDNFKGSTIWYWHDTGHAQVQENLGILKHLQFMELYKDHLLGIHLHDVKDTYDHLAPSKGEFDFRTISSYIKKETIKVIEAHQPATASDITEAKSYLEGIFDGRF